jgi:hypothetical protein
VAILRANALFWSRSENNMSKARKNATRERRIEMEIIVDAYDAQEQAMGWYYYLEEKLQFPFAATCVAERAISPLHKGDEVEILAMAPEKECQHEMFVMMRRERRGLAVPLSQVKPISEMDEDTRDAIADWHYWVAQGHRL